MKKRMFYVFWKEIFLFIKKNKKDAKYYNFIKNLWKFITYCALKSFISEKKNLISTGELVYQFFQIFLLLLLQKVCFFLFQAWFFIFFKHLFSFIADFRVLLLRLLAFRNNLLFFDPRSSPKYFCWVFENKKVFNFLIFWEKISEYLKKNMKKKQRLHFQLCFQSRN